MPKVVVDGNDPGENGDELEALSDVEMAMAFAPKALTTVYTSANTDLQQGLFLAIQRTVDDNAVSILNVSFGGCEKNLGAAANAFLNEIFQQAAAQGITVTVSSVDSGSQGCDMKTGLGVNGLASTPWNVAVGGTDFGVLYNTDLSVVKSYIDVPGTQSTVLGNPPYYGSAHGYITEMPWNDSTTVFSTYDKNTRYMWGNGIPNTMGTGGGKSSHAVCSGTISSTGSCSTTLTGYSKPTFQTAVTPTDNFRDIPDVSFFSGAFMSDDGYSIFFNASWSICSDSSVNQDGGRYTDCLVGAGTEACGGTCAITNDTSTTPVGGTSLSSPSMAGVLALVSQSLGGQRLGQADYVLYNLAAKYPAIFHDVTTGNNSVPCVAQSTDCSGWNSFLAGYNATTGYDLASGIGSIDVAQLVSNWSLAKFTQSTTTLKAGTSAGSLGTAALAVTHGAPVYFQVNVSPTTAGGSIVLTTTSSQSNSDAVVTIPVANGIASFSTQALPGGTYTVYARYAGDALNTGSQSQGIQITVSPESSSLQINLNTYSPKDMSPTAAVYGSVLYADVTPYGVAAGKGNPATGTVSLSQNGSVIASAPVNSNGTAAMPIPANATPSVGTYSFSASYSGDASYKASSGTQSVTIGKTVPQVLGPIAGSTVTWDPAYHSYALSLGFEVYTLGAGPSGAASFTVDGKQVGSVTMSSSPAGENEWIATSALPYTPDQIGIGNTATVTAWYSGDANYQAIAPITYTITVREPDNAGLTLTNSGAIAITAAGQGGTSTVSVAPANGFQGQVQLSCALTSAAVSKAPTCSLSSSSITISGTTAQTVTATITTTAATTQAAKAPVAVAWKRFAGGGIALAMVFAFGVPRRRRWLSVLVVLGIGTALLIPMGCSGGAGGGTGGGTITIPGTPAGTYTFTITGTHGTITGSNTLTVTVQ